MCIDKKNFTMNHFIPFKPYIINAFYNWAIDDNKTPYIQVSKSHTNDVPSYLKDNDFLVLRLHNDSAYNLKFSIDSIEFLAYFKGFPYELKIPYQNIRSIFCKETRYGLNFDTEENIYEQKSLNNEHETINDKQRAKFTLIQGGKTE